MIKKDYILRLISQLAHVLRRILFQKESGNFEEAKQDIKKAYKDLLGLDSGIIHSLSESELVNFLQIGEKAETGKSLVAAMLLKEEADILDRQNGDISESIPLYEKSISLFIHFVINATGIDTTEYSKEIESIFEKIRDYELSAHTETMLARYMEYCNRK